MNLTPEQIQLLQAYSQKNRNYAPPAQAQQFQAQPMAQSSGSGGAASILHSIGGLFDTAPTQGAVQPGQPALPQGGQSWLTQFANRLDPEAEQKRQILAQYQNGAQSNPQLIKTALMKAGIL